MTDQQRQNNFEVGFSYFTLIDYSIAAITIFVMTAAVALNPENINRGIFAGIGTYSLISLLRGRVILGAMIFKGTLARLISVLLLAIAILLPVFYPEDTMSLEDLWLLLFQS